MTDLQAVEAKKFAEICTLTVEKKRAAALQAFQKKLASLKFLDIYPAYLIQSNGAVRKCA